MGSDDTVHSDSSTVAQTTIAASNSSGGSGSHETGMRENGNGDVNHTGNGSVDGGNGGGGAGGGSGGGGGGGGGGGDGAANNNEQPRPSQGLNLKMSAKELRAQLAARKKYDPKKETIGFKDKFDIVQKL